MKIFANHFLVKCRITQVKCSCTTIVSPTLGIVLRMSNMNVAATHMPRKFSALQLPSVFCRDSIKHVYATQAMHYDVAVEAIRRPPPGQAEPPPLAAPRKAPPREVIRSGIIDYAN